MEKKSGEIVNYLLLKNNRTDRVVVWPTTMKIPVGMQVGIPDKGIFTVIEHEVEVLSSGYKQSVLTKTKLLSQITVHADGRATSMPNTIETSATRMQRIGTIAGEYDLIKMYYVDDKNIERDSEFWIGHWNDGIYYNKLGNNVVATDI